MTDSTHPQNPDKYSKEHPWYYKDLTSHLAPNSRKLLEDYSHISPEDVDSHVYKMVPSSPALPIPANHFQSANPPSATSSGPKPPIPA